MWPLHRQPGEPPCSPKRPQGQWAQSPPLWTPSTNRPPFGCRHAFAHGYDQRGFRPLLDSPSSVFIGYNETYMFLTTIHYVIHMFHIKLTMKHIYVTIGHRMVI